MKVLQDKERELIWYTFNHKDDYKFASHLRRLDSYLKEVDKWGEYDSVKAFMGSGKPLGHHLYNYSDNTLDTHMYFGTNLQGQLMTVLVASRNDFLKNSNALLEYLKEGFDDRCETEEYITKKQITTLFKNDDYNNLFLSYNVVNPKHHNEGIGTRVLQSVKNNLEFFAGENCNNLQMIVDKSNLASHRVVYKNGFRRLNPAKNKDTDFSIYYFSPRENFNEQNCDTIDLI